MAVDTYTSDRLHDLEKRFYQLESKLHQEKFDREMTLTYVIGFLVQAAVLIFVIAATANHQ